MAYCIIMRRLSQRLTFNLKFAILTYMTTKPRYPIRINAPLDDKNLHDYVHQVGALEQLSAEEEHQLVLSKEIGDEDAARQIVLSNLWYVIYEAKQFTGYQVPLADLIQEGNIGLMKAVKKFSPKYEIRVASYAKHWIRSAMNEYVIKNSRLLKVATTKAQRKMFFKLRSEKQHDGQFTGTEINNVAKKYDVKPSVVVEMEQRLGNTSVPFEPQFMLTNQTHDELHVSPSDWLSSSTPEPDKQFDIDIPNTKMQVIQSAMKSVLTDREKDIIQQRWMSEEIPILEVLAEKYSISQERIRQIEAAALDKIRRYASLYQHKVH